jgi:hypothetical protein
LGAGIFGNKVVVSSLALSHPSYGEAEPSFFHLMELQRLEFDWRNKGSDDLVNRVEVVELAMLMLSLNLCITVRKTRENGQIFGSKGKIFLQIIVQLMVASRFYTIDEDIPIYWYN